MMGNTHFYYRSNLYIARETSPAYGVADVEVNEIQMSFSSWVRSSWLSCKSSDVSANEDLNSNAIGEQMVDKVRNHEQS